MCPNPAFVAGRRHPPSSIAAAVRALWTSRPTRAMPSNMLATSHSWGVGARPILTPGARTSMRGMPADPSSPAREPTVLSA